jgi:mRNA interferase MazF
VRRGDLITVATPGDYGKPRPALVVQADAFEPIPSVTVLPLTSELREAPLLRITLQPSDVSGLRSISQVMVDKVITIPRHRAGGVIGQVPADAMLMVNMALRRFLGLAD